MTLRTETLRTETLRTETLRTETLRTETLRTETWRPARALEIIAGTPPGGGLDRAARALAAAITAEQLVDVPVKVVNIGGEGGRKSWAHIDRCRGDGHIIGISSPNMMADYLMGVSAVDPEHFSPLAILYSEYIAFVVRSDGLLHSGADLLARSARDAAGVTIALSTSLGNSNHVAVAKVIFTSTGIGCAIISCASASTCAMCSRNWWGEFEASDRICRGWCRSSKPAVGLLRA
ncbi:MAG: hypothetical protein IT537_10560 [Hyphomicrobiales bacterium]|nr:hypothetical protein [Hyphomicrobiales bacterium]